MGVKIFVDFDGTITHDDVGNLFFRTFGGPACSEAVREYREGRISAVECFTREAAAVGEFNPEEARRFFRGQSIDESFRSLVAFGARRGFEVVILSDGLDYYIREILAGAGMDGLRVYSNKAECLPASTKGMAVLSLSFPHTDSECDRCACCKRNIMLTTTADTDVKVLIGEGFSDTCPARYADIVFAKSLLQTYCQRENISYFPYQTFQDVVDKLDNLTKDGRSLKQGKRAELRRQEVFRTE